MKNREIAKIFRNIALLLEINGDMVFKTRAYIRAAQLLENLEEDIEDVYKRNGLNELPGVGEKLSKKIVEYIEEGKISHYDKLKKKIPVDIEELDKVQGLGPKTIMKLYKLLSVKNIKDLEAAAKAGKISKIKRLGPVAEQNILKSIAFAKQSSSRHLLGDALNLAESIKDKLSKLKVVDKIEIAGSVRRMKETIGDIDILVASKDVQGVMNEFVNLEGVEKILAKGPTKSSVRLNGIQVDLRVVEKNAFGAGLLYFTGSQQHNIILRKIAIKNNMKLSEYGVFDKESDKLLASKTEKDCYKKLGLNYIEPELREDTFGIDLNKKLPKLIELKDIKGDMQMHTTFSDGKNSVFEMAQAAQNLGYEYLLFTDHLGKSGPGNPMEEFKLDFQKKEIEDASKKLKIKVLRGAEVDIQTDGSVQVSNRVLKELDVVVGAIHFGFKNSKEQIMKRLTSAMENEHIDIIGHPSGRKLNERPSYQMDFEEILDVAKRTRTVLEINALQKRLDLNDVMAHMAAKTGVKLVISTDAHSTTGLNSMRLGVGTARRGFVTKNDVINTLGLKEMMKCLK